MMVRRPTTRGITPEEITPTPLKVVGRLFLNGRTSTPLSRRSLAPPRDGLLVGVRIPKLLSTIAAGIPGNALLRSRGDCLPLLSTF